jgi:serine/threonine protein kinase
MAEMTAEEVVQRVFELGLVNERQFQEIRAAVGREGTPVPEVCQFLLRRELLSNYQLDRLLKGEKIGYFYGDYKVIYLVSSGSFARVYRAAHKETNKVVALKVLRKRYRDKPEQKDHFCREGEVGVNLRHPNIVPIFEVCGNAPTPFLVMEFIEGQTLRDFLKIRKKLEPIEATKLMADITSGLSYATQRGISHRDLKTSNVLISSRGQAKLLDFGLAGNEGDSDDATDEQPNQRTVDYAGLEKATGVRKDDPRSDIYFLGCIYYNLLTGIPPLGESKDKTFRGSKLRFVDVVPIQTADPSVPRVAAQVVAKAMNLDANARYQTPAEMLSDLTMTAQRLAQGTADQASGAPGAGDALAPHLIPESQRKRWMIVEANPRMQDLLRETLKKLGYRALITVDPQRALSGFQDNQKPADGVIFSTGQLDETALAAFQSFAQGEQTQKVPCLLLLDERHADWEPQAQGALSDHRKLMLMPVRMKQFSAALAALVPPLG